MNVALQTDNQCKICGADISFFESVNNRQRELAICGSVECLNVLKQKDIMPPAAFDVYLTSYRRVIEQRNLRLEIREELQQQEREENLKIFARLKEKHAGSEHEPGHMVVLPTGHAHQVPMDKSRVEKYREHLEKVITEAFEYASVDDVPRDNNHDAHEKILEQNKLFARQPRLKEISDQFCMLCKGGCCARGQEHAYISASHIRRLLDADPDLTADQLLDAYLSRLQDSSTANACINQGPTGCVLPRELRSSTCNQFFCASIKKFQSKVESDDDISTVAVVQREQSLWNRSYTSEPNEVTSITLVTHNDISSVSLVSADSILAVDSDCYESEETS